MYAFKTIFFLIVILCLRLSATEATVVRCCLKVRPYSLQSSIFFGFLRMCVVVLISLYVSLKKHLQLYFFLGFVWMECIVEYNYEHPSLDKTDTYIP